MIEETFKGLTERSDIGIILINQSVSTHTFTRSHLSPSTNHAHSSLLLSSPLCESLPPTQIANDIRGLLRDYHKPIPTILEIPSKDAPYDPEQDSVMHRVNMMLGSSG